MGNLPQDKIEKLADKVADDIVREVQKNLDDLRKHEVSRGDQTSIVREGFRRASNKRITPQDP